MAASIYTLHVQILCSIWLFSSSICFLWFPYQYSAQIYTWLFVTRLLFFFSFWSIWRSYVAKLNLHRVTSASNSTSSVTIFSSPSKSTSRYHFTLTPLNRQTSPLMVKPCQIYLHVFATSCTFLLLFYGLLLFPLHFLHICYFSTYFRTPCRTCCESHRASTFTCCAIPSWVFEFVKNASKKSTLPTTSGPRFMMKGQTSVFQPSTSILPMKQWRPS